MNDGYLSAECAFTYLFDAGFIYYTNWRHNTKELYYTVYFTLKGTRTSTVSFEVTVSDGIHKIPKSNIRILEKRFAMDFNNLFTDYAID